MAIRQFFPFALGIYLLPPRSETPLHLGNGLVPVGTNAPPLPVADVIFVHGLGSFPDSTWHKPLPGQRTKYPEGVHWIRDLLPEDIPDVRLFLFNYDSTTYNDAPQKTLHTIGDELLLAIEHSRAHAPEWQKDTPIIFVCHSYGGLVVKEALRTAAAKATSSTKNNENYPHPLQHTWGNIFLGVPHYGTDYWWYCYLFALFLSPNGSNPSIFRALAPGSDELTTLHGDFTESYAHVKVVNFFETRRQTIAKDLGRFAPAKTIVRQESATFNGSNVENHSLDYDHSGLNKYNSVSDLGYINIVSTLKHMVDSITEEDYGSGKRKADFDEAFDQIMKARKSPRCNTDLCKRELDFAAHHVSTNPTLALYKMKSLHDEEIQQMEPGWRKTTRQWGSHIKFAMGLAVVVQHMKAECERKCGSRDERTYGESCDRYIYY